MVTTLKYSNYPTKAICKLQFLNLILKDEMSKMEPILNLILKDEMSKMEPI